MPHLSPISWPITLLSFWLTLSLLTTLMWWVQLPHFPNLPFSHSSSDPRPMWAWK